MSGLLKSIVRFSSWRRRVSSGESFSSMSSTTLRAAGDLDLLEDAGGGLSRGEPLRGLVVIEARLAAFLGERTLPDGGAATVGERGVTGGS
jgi:hypothetical protein